MKTNTAQYHHEIYCYNYQKTEMFLNEKSFSSKKGENSDIFCISPILYEPSLSIEPLQPLPFKKIILIDQCLAIEIINGKLDSDNEFYQWIVKEKLLLDPRLAFSEMISTNSLEMGLSEFNEFVLKLPKKICKQLIYSPDTLKKHIIEKDYAFNENLALYENYLTLCANTYERIKKGGWNADIAAERYLQRVTEASFQPKNLLVPISYALLCFHIKGNRNEYKKSSTRKADSDMSRIKSEGTSGVNNVSSDLKYFQQASQYICQKGANGYEYTITYVATQDKASVTMLRHLNFYHFFHKEGKNLGSVMAYRAHPFTSYYNKHIEMFAKLKTQEQ